MEGMKGVQEGYSFPGVFPYREPIAPKAGYTLWNKEIFFNSAIFYVRENPDARQPPATRRSLSASPYRLVQ